MKKILTILFLFILTGFCYGVDSQSFLKERGDIHVQELSPDGKIVNDFWTRNSLANEGEYYMLDATYRQATQATNFYVRLYYNTTPTVTSTLTSLSSYEVSGNGYSAQTLQANSTGFPTLALNGSHERVVSAEVTFTASGGSMGPISYLALATSTDTSGKLILYTPLPVIVTVASGNTLKITIYITQSSS